MFSQEYASVRIKKHADVFRLRGDDMKRFSIATWCKLEDREPAYALVADFDLVVVRFDEKV